MKYNLYIYLLPLIFLSCNGESNSSIENSSLNDSLNFYIEEYKNQNLSSQDKNEILLNAYKFAKQLNSDSLKNNYFKKISYQLYKVGDTTNFLNVNKEGIELSEKIKDSATLAILHWDAAFYYIDKRLKNKEAYERYFKAKSIFEDLGNDYNAAKMLLNMAIIQTNVRDYIGSENTTITAINKFEPLGKQQYLYSCYNNIGIINNELEEYQDALYYHRKALKTLDKFESDPTLKAVSLNNIGVVYKNKGSFDEAITSFNQALKVDSLFHKNTILYSALLDNIAYSNFKRGNNSEIPYLFYKAKQIRDSIEFDPGMIESRLNLSDYFLGEGDYEKALSYATEAKKLSEESNYTDDILASLLKLSKLDTINARAYANRYIVLSDSLQAQERLMQNKFARIRYETDEYIDKNNALSERVRNITISLLIALVVFGLLFVIKSQLTKNKQLQLEREQQLANEQIYNLMIDQQNKISEGRKREKQRISKELHDGVLGSLFGTRLSLGSLNTKQDENAINNRQNYIDRLKEIEEEIRSISHNLQSKILKEEQVFTSLIEELLEIQSKAGNFNYSIQFQTDLDWDMVDGKVKINIYRILQEAIQNINKYADANEVLLTFNANQNHIKVIIEDDGVGFKVQKKSQGIGLSNMTSRVKALQGTIKITSELSKGTLIEVNVPKTNYFDKKTA
jgi:signal transduction histidine kinase/tetratricopeptide (TPR) repeat protein